MASNTHRLVALAFPVAMLLVAGGVDRLRTAGLLSGWGAIAIGAAGAGVALVRPNVSAPWWLALAIVGAVLAVEAVARHLTRAAGPGPVDRSAEQV
jgi:hypothetical protein